MSTKKFACGLAAVALVLIVCAATANASLLINDTFNTSGTYSGSSSTVLNNQISGRQSGSLTGGGLTTVSWYYADHYASTAGLNGSAAYVTVTDNGSGKMPKISLDHDFTDSAITSGGGFIINFRLDPAATSLAFGGTAGGNRTSAADKSEFGRTPAGDEWDYILDLNDTGWATTRSNDGLGGRTGSGAGTGTYSTGYHDVQVKVTTTGFSSGTSFTAEFSIDAGAVLNTFNGPLPKLNCNRMGNWYR